MISSLAFAASRDVVSGIGTLSDKRMPVSVRSTVDQGRQRRSGFDL